MVPAGLDIRLHSMWFDSLRRESGAREVDRRTDGFFCRRLNERV